MKIILHESSEGKLRKIHLIIPNFLLSLAQLFKVQPVVKTCRDGRSADDPAAGREEEKTRQMSLEEETDSADIQFTREQIRVLKRELKKMRKDHPGLPLIEVREADGDGVTIYP